MRVRGFRALRPAGAMAEDVASVPYDTVNTREARKLAERRPYSFLRVVRSDLEFPDGCDLHADEIYERSAENFRKLIADGVMAQDPDIALYVYRQIMGVHAQSGIVGCSHVEDYLSGAIKKHEKTLKAKEDDRLRHALAINANAGPVFLAYRDEACIDAVVGGVQKRDALYDFTAEDGVRHTVWKMSNAECDSVTKAFASIESTYIADGHHRAAAASRAALEKAGANSENTGDEEYNWFMTVLFPASQLQIMSYNRAVKDLNGLDVEAFLARVSEVFAVKPQAEGVVGKRGRCSMYLAGKWYGLDFEGHGDVSDPVASLDVSILQEKILAPVLGIEDPRTSNRIDFVGGIRGIGELSAMVDSGRAAVAFAMYPVGMDQVMAVSDAGMIMAPKCTWFEPKLRSGLLVHLLD